MVIFFADITYSSASPNSIPAITFLISIDQSASLWNTGEYDGASLTVAAFEKMLPGSLGAYVCLGAVVLFGLSCLISYYTYAEQASEYLFGEKSKFVIRVLWVVAIFVGSQTTLGFVWDLADTFNGLMIIPNLIGIVLLSNEVVRLKKQYFSKELIKK